jgi:hypothetical protein
MGKKKKQHINNLNEYIKTAESRAKYSLERFDILIITLSSGGIALSMGFFENFKEINKTQVYIGCVFFAIAVIINLLSQITGYYANRFDIKYSIQEVRELEKKEFESDYKKYDCYKRVFDFITTLFNISSLLCFITGMTFIILFLTKLKY